MKCYFIVVDHGGLLSSSNRSGIQSQALRAAIACVTTSKRLVRCLSQLQRHHVSVAVCKSVCPLGITRLNANYMRVFDYYCTNVDACSDSIDVYQTFS